MTDRPDDTRQAIDDRPPVRVTAADIAAAEADRAPKPKLQRLLSEPTVFDR